MKNFTLSLLATTILSTVALQANAAATKDPEIYFYPAKTWIVGHAENPTDCAVQSEFNNGFVLQFDGKNKAIESFSVNFRQNIFTEGQNYNVTLNVPGKTAQKISATATSPTMLTMPLRDKAEIYQAAKDSAVIDVGVDENNFRFFLVNFAPAAKNFENCMAGIEMNATQPARAATTPVKAEPVREANAAPTKTNAKTQSAIEAPQAPGTRNPAAVPPPPNGRDIMANGEEPVNESIAMEQKEAANTVPITEILPNNPQASIQTIPFTEKDTIGKQPLSKDEAAKLDADTPEQASAELQKPAYRKRMSEELAEEMAKNPKMANLENNPLPTADSINAEINAKDDMAPPSIKPETKQVLVQPPKSAPLPVPGQLAAAQPQAIAPTVEERVMDAKQSQAFAANNPAPAPLPSEAQAMAAQKPVPDMASPDAPFSQHGEIIKTDAAPGKQANSIDKKPLVKMVEQASLPGEPVAPPAAAPNGKTKIASIKSPQPVVHTNSYKMNADLTGDTNLDKVEPASQDANAPFVQFDASTPKGTRHTADPEMLQKISDLEAEISKLQKENVSLNDELKGSVTGAEKERMSIASDNWNLESATMRYNEAERQVKVLGQQIQLERAQCAGDKKDLESQLFDPQITSQQQLAKLADLQQKLADAQQKLQDQKMHYEERLKIMQSNSATQ